MPNLVEQIEAAAAAKLALPAGRSPQQEIARYKTFLKVESHRLRIHHRAGGGGRANCRARGAMMDALLRQLLAALERSAPPRDKALPPVALVAIGGYGRGELNPCSDVDIMILHTGEAIVRGQTHPWLAMLEEGLLWDLGLKVGHAVRSLKDCEQVANNDMQSKTSLIEARLITGNQPLFELFQQLVLEKCVQGHEDEYIAARIEDQRKRRAAHGDSPTMQEPNIKNGCGGLRDFQNLLWMAFFKYRVRSLAELQTRGLISTSDVRRLEAAYDFLLRTRTELHYTVNRAGDVLTRNLQPAVGRGLGYTERSLSRRIELFLGDFYTHTRTIYLLTRALEERLALLPQPSRLPSLGRYLRSRLARARQQELDGFKLLDGQLQATSVEVFREQPARLMRVFLYAQQRGLKLDPNLFFLIHDALPLVDRAFLRDLHVRDTFLEILRRRGNVGATLRLMHETGLLGKYLPEFGKLTALVQHEFFHRYTTDEHTLICLEKLDQVWESTVAPFRHYAEMFRALERPDLLYLALLLHDTGKVEQGKHADLSTRLAQSVGRRLQLDAPTTRTLCLLIEHHLLMARTSQAFDLEDRTVIRHFAEQIGSLENLNLLTLLTFADSMGTSEQFWNGFKDTSLLTLYAGARQELTGSPHFAQAEERQLEHLAGLVKRLLPETFGLDEMQAHFDNLPPRYFTILTNKEIVADLTLTHLFMRVQVTEPEEKALTPVLDWLDEPDRGYTAVKLCTWDRPGLFWKMAGSFSASGLSILSARVFTRADGIALDTFFVVDAETGALVDRQKARQFERIASDELIKGNVDLAALIAKRKAAVPLYSPLFNEPIPTRIEFDNRLSDATTAILIETQDRLGLLFAVAKVLSALSLDIVSAKIQTEKGAALDSFHVREASGLKVLLEDRQRHITLRLLEAIEALDRAQAKTA